jgi:hypothetical protein
MSAARAPEKDVTKVGYPCNVRIIRAIAAVATLTTATMSAGAAARVQMPPSPESGGPGAESGHEQRQSTADAEASTLGRVTYAAARVDVPITRHAVLIPLAELLYLAPVASDPTREFHPSFGAAVGLERPGDWEWELSIMYGPRSYGVTSSAAAIDLSRSFGLDGDRERAPSLSVDVSLNARQLGWRPVSLVGADVAQFYFDASARMRISEHFTLRPRAMVFVYDRPLVARTADQVDAMSALALVGTYAPRALVGTRLTWRATSRISPFVEADEIAYAAGVGSATELVGGLRVDLGHGLHATAAGGLLHNRLRGVATELDDQRTVPVLEGQWTVRY